MKQLLKKYNSGFSLIILIVVILSIGIVTTVAIIGYNTITKKTGSSEQINQADTNTNAAQANLEWITIGTQKWANINLNVGTMITGDKDQTDNSILEKYCYDDDESNCTTYGALYQWNEAMQYVNTEGAQGICPDGSHIPSDNDWKILEMQLGMTADEADTIMWRGTDQGTQLKPEGSSGLDIPFAGNRTTDGSFLSQSTYAVLWTSSEVGPNGSLAHYRDLIAYGDSMYRNAAYKTHGHSVRCVEQISEI